MICAWIHNDDEDYEPQSSFESHDQVNAFAPNSQNVKKWDGKKFGYSVREQ